MSEKSEPVLSVRNLTVDFPRNGRMCHAVSNVSFQIRPGEMAALVGESGCGKTVTALTVMGLQPETASIPQGKLLLQGRSLRGMKESQWNELRGKEMSMIFQEPMTALNPLMRVGDQIAEGAWLHGASKAEAKARALEMMEQVGLPDVSRLYREYPHRLSGGQRQRVMIAMALINRPSLLIADEPTTALDVTIQAQIMELLRELNRKLGTAVLLISHDLGVIRRMCSRVTVMYAGQAVESGPMEEVLSHPWHPYTKGLVASVPSLQKRGNPLQPIPGVVPPLEERRDQGCPFYNRCSRRRDSCAEGDIPLLEKGGHRVFCADGKEGAGL